MSEWLRDLGLPHPPCQDLNANRSFYTLAGWGWNRMQALALWHLPEEEQLPKRMRTLIRHWLRIPVEWKRHARQRKACLYGPAGWVAWGRELLGELLPRCRVLSGVGAVESG